MLKVLTGCAFAILARFEFILQDGKKNFHSSTGDSVFCCSSIYSRMFHGHRSFFIIRSIVFPELFELEYLFFSVLCFSCLYFAFDTLWLIVGEVTIPTRPRNRFDYSEYTFLSFQIRLRLKSVFFKWVSKNKIIYV